MHISFTFKNFEPSEHLRKYARRRMEKLGRFFGKNPALDAQVNMAVDKFRQRVEVQLTGDGINIAASEVSEDLLRAEETSNDMYASIDLVLDKLEAQVKKFVSRNKEIHRKGRANDIDVYTFEVTEEDGERTITGRDHFSPKPMSSDEAAMQLDANDFEFLTFLNSENDRINVIYRRKNGNLGLIDPIF